MLKYKALSFVTFWGGMLILAIGFFLKAADCASTSTTFGRYGNISHKTITGNGALGIGIAVLLCAMLSRKWERDAIKERNEMLKDDLKNDTEKKYNIMAENKTKATEVSVTEFIQKVENEVRRKDSFILVDLFKSITGHEPKMWGPTIIGFGQYHYKYASGHEGDMPIAAFSPRKDSLVFYFEPVFPGKEKLLEQLGKHKSSKGCVYVKKLEDINLGILEDMAKASIKETQTKYPDK